MLCCTLHLRACCSVSHLRVLLCECCVRRLAARGSACSVTCVCVCSSVWVWIHQSTTDGKCDWSHSSRTHTKPTLPGAHGRTHTHTRMPHFVLHFVFCPRHVKAVWEVSAREFRREVIFFLCREPNACLRSADWRRWRRRQGWGYECRNGRSTHYEVSLNKFLSWRHVG